MVFPPRPLLGGHEVSTAAQVADHWAVPCPRAVPLSSVVGRLHAGCGSVAVGPSTQARRQPDWTIETNHRSTGPNHQHGSHNQNNSRSCRAAFWVSGREAAAPPACLPDRSGLQLVAVPAESPVEVPVDGGDPRLVVDLGPRSRLPPWRWQTAATNSAVAAEWPAGSSGAVGLALRPLVHRSRGGAKKGVALDGRHLGASWCPRLGAPCVRLSAISFRVFGPLLTW